MGLFDMIKALHPDSKLFGFLAGPYGIYSNNYTEITPDFMSEYRNMGGFDMISKFKNFMRKIFEENIKSQFHKSLVT
jgi:pyrophosphate--fructose-6-phosphate 1-phosphotransferase